MEAVSLSTAALYCGIATAVSLTLIAIYQMSILATLKKSTFNVPFVGALALLWRRKDNTDWMLELAEKNGWGNTFSTATPDVFPVSLRCMQVISSPENVEYILKKNFKNYEKGRAFKERFQEILGHGIFNVDGSKWKMQRKTASHMFNQRTLRDTMFPIFKKHAIEAMNKVRKTQKGQIIDIQKVCFAFTLDSIGEIAFGINVDSQHKEEVEFAKAFDTGQLVAVQRFFDVGWRFERLFTRCLPFAAQALGLNEAKLQSAVQVMNKFADDIIKERRKDDISSRRDILSMFMKYRGEEGDVAGGGSDGKENSLSDKYLRDVIMNYMIAGRDTTANALTWVFYLISKAPDVEKKLVAEVRKAFSNSLDAEKHLDWDILMNKLPYCEAVVKETLRLYPSVPKDPKMAVEDDYLPDGTFVRAGSFVTYFAYGMGRNTKIWGEDASSFKPDRWMEDGKCSLRPSPFEYPVFQAGYRTCLGQTMAVIEAKTMLAVAISSLHLDTKPGHVGKVGLSVTCPMKDGLPMFVQVR
jgi:fatty acid omega-hydroxylase